MMIERTVSDAIFRYQLEGFRDYPRGRDSRFLEVFHESVVSVEHARSVVKKFEGAGRGPGVSDMPTLTEIRDTARNCRAQFEDTIDQRAEWARKYGPPSPFVADFSRKPEREIDKLWREVLTFFRSNNFDGKGDIQKVHYGRCWQIARALGYSMNSYQTREIEDYERIYPRSRESLPVRPKPKPITQADIDALPKRDGKLLASGDDSGSDHA